MRDSVKRYVLGADLHFPKVDWKTWNVMLNLIADITPHGFIFQGDQFDNEEISHHNHKKPYYKEKGSYKRNTEQFNKKCLEPLENLLSKADKTWIIGNHDDWEFQTIELAPEMEGHIDRVSELDLRKRGWEIVKLGLYKTIGCLDIIHGEGLAGGMYSARKAVDTYGRNVVAAHTHAPQSFSRSVPRLRQKNMGWVSPILGNCNPGYMKNKPTAWMNGFTVVEFFGKQFNLYQVMVFNGVCSYGGKVYRG